MSLISSSKPIVLALGLGAAALAGPAAAQYQVQGVDPQMLMALDQVLSYSYYACQSGNQMMCQNLPNVQQEVQTIIYASQMCFGYNNPQACQYYQFAQGQVQQAMMQMQGMMQVQPQVPSYDPGNPLGPDHYSRMNNIANIGAQNTANFNQRMQQMDQNHNNFMSTLR